MSNNSCIYKGYVYHTRHTVPQSSNITNSFKYPVMYLYLDLNEIDKTFINIPFASINRYNLISWFRHHYIGDPNISLNEYIKQLIYSHCNKKPDKNGKVYLLTLPSQFGYGFNPVSIYYCFNESHTKIQAIVCEVHNTPWLETHCYILPFFDYENDNNINDKYLYTCQWPKAFHVSPFYTLNYEYIWSFNNPNINRNKFKSFGSLLKYKNENDKMNVNIKTHKWGTSSLGTHIDLQKNGIDNNKYIKAFDFGFRDMERMEMNNKNMVLFLLYCPVICCVIQLWIHWQAFKVYYKGISIKQHPKNKYVNPFTFWIKHIIIFVMAVIGEIFAFIPTMIKKYL
eukprot:193231_1